MFTFINTNKQYSQKWQPRKTDNQYIQGVLDKTSKNRKENKGYPDLIYINENKKLLILIENKANIKDHVSKEINRPMLFAVDSIKHYLYFFTEKKLDNVKDDIQRYLADWKVIGIAFSGDINEQYNHRLDTFIINESSILDEEDYIAYFENIDLEKIATDISRSSKKINSLLRNIDSQRRPVLLSSLMICMYPNKQVCDFKNSYKYY